MFSLAMPIYLQLQNCPIKVFRWAIIWIFHQRIVLQSPKLIAVLHLYSLDLWIYHLSTKMSPRIQHRKLNYLLTLQAIWLWHLQMLMSIGFWRMLMIFHMSFLSMGGLYLYMMRKNTRRYQHHKLPILEEIMTFFQECFPRLIQKMFHPATIEQAQLQALCHHLMNKLEIDLQNLGILVIYNYRKACHTILYVILLTELFIFIFYKNRVEHVFSRSENLSCIA